MVNSMLKTCAACALPDKIGFTHTTHVGNPLLMLHSSPTNTLHQKLNSSTCVHIPRHAENLCVHPLAGRPAHSSHTCNQGTIDPKLCYFCLGRLRLAACPRLRLQNFVRMCIARAEQLALTQRICSHPHTPQTGTRSVMLSGRCPSTCRPTPRACARPRCARACGAAGAPRRAAPAPRGTRRAAAARPWAPPHE